jgi:hypothetical protein
MIEETNACLDLSFPASIHSKFHTDIGLSCHAVYLCTSDIHPPFPHLL